MKRRRLAQHFLRDPSVAEYIAGLVPSGLDVIEVGPGAGALTIPLAKRSKTVYAIEIDKALAERLRGIAPPNVVIIVGDALEVEWPRADFFVSNVPYSITSPLLFKLIRHRLPAVLTIQREVAERLVARPGSEDYGRLTVAVQCFYDVEILRVLPPYVFDPPPKVYSAVVRLMPKAPCVDNFDEFEKFSAWLFSARRKTLRRLKLADSTKRVYQLTLEELVELFKRHKA
ncbi:16S rRNA (adenine(1518)-N(6)/adenine(1519)-N(6))-dimethyltransferase RsmA [Pyrobaculum aerophilum]|uniref:Probable ribosomal RNA small subunit methyltransferase A n=2 Tax=Pyrobaculum aerophilum TaxID=13773 RepID=RSMA_PYRAE|nr:MULTISPECIES: 16S rRNA (adenine(1518)-N(6)/adenine(1519)-N(6))-dimethyltransferase RsmA [Pyrobaculum]Q8ZTJ4.1 RecName: Full=Probable ribosomal RNA small subunit methyltransferase A; AltName: Full=16S rRNA dimethyladenosine transferase; AltName: Full=16S rRNA dimethylase; AltName: Full=S-adenosylmethionine-6-N',N'-adenosyl(rRNA) dimethyltransferase [Pyrobaculum aerophilum str. IM2]AAL64767.1 dimethyladenosine transferase [Pyrobaculum aerophilum str. IM2]MCX8136277.1 16S rRNA (adenine(1518)-N(6